MNSEVGGGVVFEGGSEGGIVVRNDLCQIRGRTNVIKTQGPISAPNSKVNVEDSSKYPVRLILL